MDGHAFDRLVQALGQGASRRGVFGTLGGIAAAGIQEVLAKRGRHKNHKNRKARKSDKRRKNKSSKKPKKCSPLGGPCGGDQDCCGYQGGKISCANGTCVGPLPPGPCDEGLVKCGDQCGDVTTDVDNCGGCGVTCPVPANATRTCEESNCGLDCDEGWGDCNNDASDGCETDLNTDEANCGACGNTCNPGFECINGGCCLSPTNDPAVFQQAINDAIAESAELVLCACTFASNATIGGNLTLRGAGKDQHGFNLSILDGAGKGRVLYVTGGTAENPVLIQDLNVEGGILFNAQDTNGIFEPQGWAIGGGIRNDGNLSLVGVTVQSNGVNALTSSPRVDGKGAGIANYRTGTLTLSETTVQQNTAAVDGNGGGIYNEGTLTLLSGAAVTGNFSTGEGGGITNWAFPCPPTTTGCPASLPPAPAVLTLEDGSSVTANIANVRGGGIAQQSGMMTLQGGSIVSGNTAVSSGGGGLWISGGTVTLAAGSIVSSNQLFSGTSGGGINRTGGTVTVNQDALVCDNAATQCVGTITGPCPNPADGICPAPSASRNRRKRRRQ